MSGLSGIELRRLRCEHPAPINVTSFTDSPHRWLCNGCGETFEGPPDSIRAAERRGYERAVANLRDLPRGAADGDPFQAFADAIADVSYAGKQVTQGHGRYLAAAALTAIVAYLEATKETDR